MGARIRIALIGAGFIGRSHALAVNAVNRVFGLRPLQVVPTVLADHDPDVARTSAERFGFERWTTDWREAVDGSDAVIIAVPSYMHREIALAAIAQGKHLLCEKPVGLSSGDAAEMAAAAAAAGITNAVGFTYMRAPLVRHARALLDSGALGAPVHFRGHHAEDYLADPDAPFGWRLDTALAGRCGVLGDLGWHILSIARYLCGPISRLSGIVRTVHSTRRSPEDGNRPRQVQNEDWAGILADFESGAVGTLDTSRVAHGRKMDIGFELVCERGTLAFHGERCNELRLYALGAPAGESGFKTIHINRAHPDYEAFIPAPAHGLGFNDLKTIELREFLLAISERRNVDPDLDEACRIARICETVLEASGRGIWIQSPEVIRAEQAPD